MTEPPPEPPSGPLPPEVPPPSAPQPEPKPAEIPHVEPPEIEPPQIEPPRIEPPEIEPPPVEPIFGSMLMGGFECAAQRLSTGRRLDVTASTGHDVRAAEDYALLRRHGMTCARDGLRWHLIEQVPGRYDWSSLVPMLRAAREQQMTIVWDLLHYGVPDDVDVFTPQFVDRFAAFSREAARVIAQESDAPAFITPVNEISFWAWAGGEVGGLNPFAVGQGDTLKRQLVRAALASGDAVRSVDRRNIIACAEPLIHVLPADGSPDAAAAAAIRTESQFEALDMLLGRQAPELGGSADAVDVVGFNYYYDNQWINGGRTVYLGDWLHRPLHVMLAEAAGRYPKPFYIAETGTEGLFRPLWLRHICDEVRQAERQGVHVGGICIYPVLSHLGWDDDRLCENGLFDAHDAFGPRVPHEALARETILQAAQFAAAQRWTAAHRRGGSDWSRLAGAA